MRATMPTDHAPGKNGLHAPDTAKAPIADFDEEMYGRVFDTNVKGVFLAMGAEIAAMRRTGGGSIVNVGATSGSRGTPNMSIYAASKHAVEGLTRSAALELAKEGIRVIS